MLRLITNKNQAPLLTVSTYDGCCLEKEVFGGNKYGEQERSLVFLATLQQNGLWSKCSLLLLEHCVHRGFPLKSNRDVILCWLAAVRWSMPYKKKKSSEAGAETVIIYIK